MTDPIESDFSARWKSAGADREELAALASGFASTSSDDAASTAPTFAIVQARARARRRERRVHRLAFGLAFSVLAIAILFSVTTTSTQPARTNPVEPASFAARAPSAERRALKSGWIELSADTTLRELEKSQLALDSGFVRAETTEPIRLLAGDLVLDTSAAIFAVRVDRGEGAVRVFAGTVTITERGRAPRELRAEDGISPRERAWGKEDDAALETWSAAAKKRRAPSALEEEVAAYRDALQLLRSGRHEAASAAFSDYLLRFPSGTLREEAELSRLEALFAGPDRPGFKRAAAAWLAEHEGHPRAAEVRKLFEAREK